MCADNHDKQRFCGLRYTRLLGKSSSQAVTELTTRCQQTCCMPVVALHHSSTGYTFICKCNYCLDSSPTGTLGGCMGWALLFPIPPTHDRGCLWRSPPLHPRHIWKRHEPHPLLRAHWEGLAVHLQADQRHILSVKGSETSKGFGEWQGQ